MKLKFRILVVGLCAVLVLLIVAIVSFYARTDNRSEKSASQTSGNLQNYQIVKDESKSYHLLDENNEELLSDEYEDLAFAYDEFLLAKQDGLYGIIDTDGNCYVPFQYSSILSVGGNWYLANFPEEGTIIYDSDWKPLYQQVWSNADLENSTVTAWIGKDSYTLDLSTTVPHILKASLNQKSIGTDYKFQWLDDTDADLFRPNQLSDSVSVMESAISSVKKQNLESLESLCQNAEIAENAELTDCKTIVGNREVYLSAEQTDTEVTLTFQTSLFIINESGEKVEKTLLATMGIGSGNKWCLTQLSISE